MSTKALKDNTPGMSPILLGVMAYEDLSVAKLAKERWDHMVSTLNKLYEFELRLWKFNALRIPEWREAAVNDALQAQLVFVVTHGAGELPPEVKTWIEQWLALKDAKHETARLLTFLFEPSAVKLGDSAFSQFAYLQQAARRGSMDFIAAPAPAQDQQSVIRLHAPDALMRSGEDHGSRARQGPKGKTFL